MFCLKNRLKEQKIFKPDVVRQLLDEHFAAKWIIEKRLWSLLIFEWWLEKWGM